MTTREHSSRTALLSATLSTLGLGLSLALFSCAQPAQEGSESVQGLEDDPMSDGAKNVRLVGYNDLQGREALQLVTRSDGENGNWLYVGHQPNARGGDEEGLLNTPQPSLSSAPPQQYRMARSTVRPRRHQARRPR